MSSRGLIITALASAVVLMSCSEKKTEKKSDVVRVETMEVSSSQESVGRSYVGTVKEAYGSSLSFSSTGTVKSVSVDEGQFVKQGQVLATLDDTQSRNSYQIAQSSLKQAEDGFKRMDELYKKGSLPEVKYVDIQTKLAEAQAAERMAKKMLQDCVLRAPFSGYIAKRSCDVGQNMMPGLSCFTLVKLDNVEVTIPVPEQEMAGIKTGQQVPFTVAALGDRRYVGKVTKKGVQADALSHTYEVTLAVGNGDRQLLPGMVCSVETKTAGGSGIVVPQGAVSTDGKKQYVWMYNGGSAQRREISAAGINAKGVVVGSGLAAGEKIIVSGMEKVSEGTKITDK